MSQSSSESKQFFLGIQGDQTGPFSESDVNEKIIKGVVPRDGLIWYEGLPDWQPIHTIEYFKDAFRQAESISVDSTSEVFASSSPETVEELFNRPKASKATSAKPKPSKKRTNSKPVAANTDYAPIVGTELEPVFSEKESAFEFRIKAGPRVMVMVSGLVVFVGIAAAYFYFSSSSDGDLFSGVAQMAIKRSDPASPREARLQKAVSELHQNPSPSLAVLEELIKENSTDEVGKEAFQSALEYHRLNRHTLEAGQLNLLAGKPLEATKYFLMDPPSYIDAQQAFYEAFKKESTDERRNYLVQSIDLLLKNVHDTTLATTRIRELEKAFPNQPHPYGYYLKTVDEKVIDLFNRTSFYFVDNLLRFIDNQFPSLSLAGRPKVEVIKLKDGNYRIGGGYQGEIILRQDKMADIFINFWLVKGQWFLVGTNLTAERTQWAEQERSRLVGEVFSAVQMLKYLETVFNAQFPNMGLHEAVSLRQTATSGPIE